MTTSYELSLKLKELGVEQTAGEYYWMITDEDETQCYHHMDSMCNTSNGYNILCRAFTLGELVRELASKGVLETCSYTGKNGLVTHIKTSRGVVAAKDSVISPEEAAGELWAQLLTQEKQKEG